MNKEEMRIAIAESVGLKCSLCNNTGKYLRFNPHEWTRQCNYIAVEQPLVDCPHQTDFTDTLPPLTLDWMHEVEKTLDGLGLLDKYRHMLRIIVINDTDKSNAAENYDWHASKEQRARAFIETMNNWNTKPIGWMSEKGGL